MSTDNSIRKIGEKDSFESFVKKTDNFWEKKKNALGQAVLLQRKKNCPPRHFGFF